ncbi:LuxR C-terminal-related transcriptional regulator [Streptacidiphilus sp. N1-3]|uniref:LuxR C-terminal-related transcriptional regulator n=1 Tax=Streptacidiphilus alkalitolerans TaxID=3342712 RepID=A0ABV6XAJ2_9ACTN
MTFGVQGKRAGDLPAEVTSFVGRGVELASVERLLNQARMVTLTGPGGVGKTRIALRTAAALREPPQRRYQDGVFLVELSGLKDAELLPRAVCVALGITDQTVRPPLDFLTDYLADRSILLLLDTCEHLVDACAMLADLLLRDAPGVSILATSRQPLDVPGEHTLVIPPLPVEPEQADGGGAVALFAQRAAAVLPGFRLTEANRGDVLALCRRLDGIPLAIELATVRLRAIPLEQLAARLEDRFRLLTGGRRTALPRHQTLRTTIGWSHELCTPEERLLWARLSVFAGSFDLAAVEQVCAGGELDPDEVVEHLIGLVDKSVVLRVDEPSEGTRYRLLDTIREYGGEWLAQTGEEPGVRARHLDHYRAAVGRFRARFLTNDQVPLFRGLLLEIENLRAAIDFCVEHHSRDPDEALALTTELWEFWVCSGLLAEGRYWLDRALARQPEATAARSLALSWAANLSLFRGDHDTALHGLNEALAIAEALDDDRLRTHAHHFLAQSAGWRGDHDAVDLHMRQVFSHIALGGDPTAEALMVLHLGLSRLLAGKFASAITAFDHQLAALADVPGERWLRGYLLVGRALSLYNLDHPGNPDGGGEPADPADCAATAREALSAKAELGEPTGIAYALEVLAWLAVRAERPDRAAWLLGAAGVCWKRSGQPLSGVREMRGVHEAAEQAARDALGEDRFERRHRLGAEADLDLVVGSALSDTDLLLPAPREEPPQTGADTLTRREREVAELVARGLSNRQVAELLVISKRTADAHVEHILAKLGASSRTEIAAVVARSQPTA